MGVARRRVQFGMSQKHLDDAHVGVALQQMRGEGMPERMRRPIKRRVRPMLGFKSPISASITLSGIEMVHMMRK